MGLYDASPNADYSQFAPPDPTLLNPRGRKGARAWMGGTDSFAGGAPTADDPRTGSHAIGLSGFDKWFERAMKAALIAGTAYVTGGASGLFGGAMEGADVAGATALGGGGVATGLPGAMAALPALGGASLAAPAIAGGVATGLPGAMTALPALGGASVAPSAVAGGTAAATAPAAGGATAHGLTASSILKAAQQLAPVLGGAAKSQSDSERFNDAFNLRAAETNADLPGKRLSSAVRAGLLSSATPYKLNWGGPGSGLRGEIPTMTGGLDLSKLPPEVQQLAQQVIHDELMQELAGPVTSTGGTGVGDKLLGGGATAAGLLGALLPLFTKSSTTTKMPYVDPGGAG